MAVADKEDHSRKRRAHKKSRRGCESCKIRRIKCDEARPQCQKCMIFGIDCSYDRNSSELKFAGESSFSLEKPQMTACNSTDLVMSTLRDQSSPVSMSTISSDSGDSLASFSWASSDFDILSRFKDRTVLTVGTPSVVNLYRHEIFKLAMLSPFLTHIVITMTLMHDRHVSGSPMIGEAAARHWYQGTTMFKNALTKPGQSVDRDALWASAALLGCIQFASIEARTPEEAWPLRPPSSSDLDWLKMSDGKKAVWKIADPTRPDSVFYGVQSHGELYRPLVFSGSDMANVTAEFCQLYGLGPSSNATDNPYHSAAMALARLLLIDCTADTILDFLRFMSQVHPGLVKLLEQKDPKALLLVACWFAKVYKYQWWIYRRGILEGQAICIYLDRYYSHSKAIQKLLQYPKMALGLLFPTSSEQEFKPSEPPALMVDV